MKFTSVLLAGVLAAGLAVPADAAKKKSSNAPTAAQRKQMFDSAMKNCRKKYGARLHYVRVEKYYGKWAGVCYFY